MQTLMGIKWRFICLYLWRLKQKLVYLCFLIRTSCRRLISSLSSKSYPPTMPSSFSQSHRSYDVFLSFRGDDTRYGFTSHLNAALTSRKIETFMDRELKKGTGLESELFQAIERSKISVIVFSQRYAGSRWCLNELVKIMECRRSGQVVLPVFYHVEPTHVRHQEGDFGKAYGRLLKEPSRVNPPDNLSAWTTALRDATNIGGWPVKEDMYESDVIQNIVERVIQELGTGSLVIAEFPVGLESRTPDVTQFLKEQSNTVLLGIWGVGGSGKTTVAKAIYNQIHHKFEGASFLSDIRERDHIDLQKQLLSDILKLNKVKIRSIDQGIDMIKKRLTKTRALIVFDDVNEVHELKALYRSRTWIGHGSVVIITTRNLHVLDVFETDHVYCTREMDESESLKLFSWHAFGEKKPTEGFIKLSTNIAAYCGGLPLALESLGIYLCKKTEKEWESVLLKLQTIPNEEVQKSLRKSYDRLSDTMQNIFLDICCFFIGKDKTYVTKILDGCELYAEDGIQVLIQQSLVNVEKKDRLGMHNLVRDMGREIIRQSSPKEPEKWSRLWLHEDVHDVLTNNTGTEMIEGLALNMQTSNGVFFGYTKTFEKMKRLRLLQLNQVDLSGDYGYLSKQLRWIHWHGFPSKYTADNLFQGNLVAIDLRHSKVKWVRNEPQVLEKLKFLNLSHSKYLKNTPDFSKLPNLEKLVLKDCPKLSMVHQSIGDLNNLHYINLKDCTNLRNLPRAIYKLKSLKTLIISGCSKIDEVEEDIEQMESLTTILAKRTAVKQVPFSILRLKNIGYISLCEYEGSSCDVFPSLIWSLISPTLNPLSSISPFGSMSSSLVSVYIHSKNLRDLSSLSSLLKLQSVWVQCCSKCRLTQDFKRILHDLYDVNVTKLKTSSALQISKHSLRSLLIGMGSYLEVINTLSSSMSQGPTASGPNDFLLPGDNYPYWLSHTGQGNSLVFKVPQVTNYPLKGMILCIISSSTSENMIKECLIGVFFVNYTKHFIKLYKRDTILSLNDKEWQSIASNLEPNDKVKIFVTCGHGLIVKKIALYQIYGDSLVKKRASSFSTDPFFTDLLQINKTKSFSVTSLKKNLGHPFLQSFFNSIVGVSLAGVLLSKFHPVTCLKFAAGLILGLLPVTLVFTWLANKFSTGVLDRPKSPQT